MILFIYAAGPAIAGSLEHATWAFSGGDFETASRANGSYTLGALPVAFITDPC